MNTHKDDYDSLISDNFQIILVKCPTIYIIIISPMQCIGYPTKLSDYMAIDGFVQSFLVISVKYRHGYKDARMYIYAQIEIGCIF